MSVLDYIIIAAVITAAVFVIIRIFRNKKGGCGGCGGDCSVCDKNK